MLQRAYFISFGFIFFISMFNQLYYFNVKIKKINDENKTLIKELEELQRHVNNNRDKVLSIENSINPQDKRFVRIKEIRGIVHQTIKENGYRSLSSYEVTQIASSVVDYSDEYSVDPALILAVLTVESAFKVDAVSKAGASGLMQLMPETAEECARDVGKVNYSVFRIKDNIQLGTWYLHKLLNIFRGKLDLTIRAYNAGPVLVKKVASDEDRQYPQETVQYLEKVLYWKNEYEKFDF